MSLLQRSALALTAYSEGRAGVARLLARIGRWQLGARLYLFAIGYMAATKLLAALIHRMAMGAWPAFGDTPLPLMLGAILASTWVQAGEEVGWRGYALPRLATHLGLGGASVLLGAVPNAVHPMSLEGSLVAWATVGVSSVVAAVLLLRMRGAEIGAMLNSGSHPPQLGQPGSVGAG